MGGGVNGPINSVSAALRKPLLEINGSSPLLINQTVFPGVESIGGPIETTSASRLGNLVE